MAAGGFFRQRCGGWGQVARLCAYDNDVDGVVVTRLYRLAVPAISFAGYPCGWGGNVTHRPRLSSVTFVYYKMTAMYSFGSFAVAHTH